MYICTLFDIIDIKVYQWKCVCVVISHLVVVDWNCLF